MLVILDMDGTLCHIHRSRLPGPREPDFCHNGRYVYVRPFLDTFLDEIFSHYDVAMWTCQTEHNARKIIEYLLGAYVHRLQFAYYQRHVDKRGTGDRSSRGWVKPIDKVLRNYNLRAHEVVLIDDSPHKAGEYADRCLLTAPTYDPHRGDTWLVAAITILAELHDQVRDVPPPPYRWERSGGGSGNTT